MEDVRFMTAHWNSRLVKGGALLEDTRLLVRAWKAEGLGAGKAQAVLGKHTTARCRDFLNRLFRPRMVDGSPPGAWRYAQVLEGLGVGIEVIRPFYFWVTARSERILRDFVEEELYARFLQGMTEVSPFETRIWIEAGARERDLQWSSVLVAKLARGLLAATRDFGILSGKVRKRITPPDLPPEAIALIAFLLNHFERVSGGALLKHADWRLFLLSETHVERLFLEAQQAGCLTYQSAGSTVRVDFPEHDFNTYAQRLFGSAI